LEASLNVVLLNVTPEPEKIAALAAKLCYTDTDISGLKGKIDRSEQTAFNRKDCENGSPFCAGACDFYLWC